MISNSPSTVGVMTVMLFGPLLVLGPWAGTLADRVDKLRIMRITQSLAMVQAILLVIVHVTGHASVNWLLGLSLLYGVIFAIDNPARRSLMVEMVEPVDIPNAASLNSVIMSGTKIAGPALGGMLLRSVGPGWAYGANALSYVAVLLALACVRRSELHQSPLGSDADRSVSAGISEVWRNPRLRLCFELMIPIGTLGFNFGVVVPIFAKYALHGDATTFSLLSSVGSAGALAGALVIARRTEIPPSLLVVLALAFGIASTGFAIAPNLVVAMLCSAISAGMGVAFIASSNSVLQVESRPEMRGRIMALSAVVFLGSTPIGGPIVGFVAEHFGPRWAASLAAFAGCAAAGWGWFRLSQRGTTDRATPVAAK